MNRRKSLKTIAAATFAAVAPLAAASTGIQLHVDLNVDPAKEKDLVKNYTTIFQPMIKKQPGFIDAKLMKLRSVPKGNGPANTNCATNSSANTNKEPRAERCPEECNRSGEC